MPKKKKDIPTFAEVANLNRPNRSIAGYTPKDSDQDREKERAHLDKERAHLKKLLTQIKSDSPRHPEVDFGIERREKL